MRARVRDLVIDLLPNVLVVALANAVSLITLDFLDAWLRH